MIQNGISSVAAVEGNNVAPSTSTVDNYAAFLNKMVIIVGGKSIGLKGVVTNIQHRGWWTIDNPQLKGKKVTAKLCRLVESMPPEHVKKYESMVGTIRGCQFGCVELDDIEDNERMGNLRDGRRSTRKTRSKSSASFKESLSLVKKCKDGEYTISGNGGSLTFPFVSRERNTDASNEGANLAIWKSGNCQSFIPRKKAKLQYTTSNFPPPLQPLLLDSHDNKNYVKCAENVDHLLPDSIINIVNRKTGRIMKGENGIKWNELSSALRTHAEYEPLIPLPSLETTGTMMSVCEKNMKASPHLRRMARSSSNARVSKTIQPQIVTYNTILEDSVVLVMAGPYQGLIGTVDSFLSKEWCMISDLFTNDREDSDVIVHSKQLKLIPTYTQMKTRALREFHSKDNNLSIKNKNTSAERVGLDTNLTESSCPKANGQNETKDTMQERSSKLILSDTLDDSDQALPHKHIHIRKNDGVDTTDQAGLTIEEVARQMLGIC